MKYLRNFNENIDNDKIETIKEILYPLSDDGIDIEYTLLTEPHLPPDLVIEILIWESTFNLKKYKNEFKSLLKFIKNNKLILDLKNSLITIDDNQTHDICPNCKSDNIEWYTKGQDDADLSICLDCNKIDDSEYFNYDYRKLKVEDFDNIEEIFYLKLRINSN